MSKNLLHRMVDSSDVVSCFGRSRFRSLARNWRPKERRRSNATLLWLVSLKAVCFAWRSGLTIGTIRLFEASSASFSAADFCSHEMSYLIRPAFQASLTHRYACRSPQIRASSCEEYVNCPRISSPSTNPPFFRFGFAFSCTLAWRDRPQ